MTHTPTHRDVFSNDYYPRAATWILFLILFIIIVLALTWWLTYKCLFNPDITMCEYPHYPYEDIYIPLDGDPRYFYSRDDKPDRPCMNMWYFGDNYSDYCDRLRKEDPSRTGFPEDRTMIFYHGNSGNISHRDYVIEVCREFGLNLLLVDYRGFGYSDGRPDIKGIMKDSLLAYDYLRTRCSPENIIIWGESLGGAAAIHVASNRRCRCLVLISTFSSLDDVIFDSETPNWFRYPVGHLVGNTTEPIPSKSKITKVSCPVIVIHSEEDGFIGFNSAKRLYNSVPHDCKLLIKINGKHSGPVITNQQLQVILEFSDVETCNCSSDKMDKMLDDVRTVGYRKGLCEEQL